MGNIITTYNEAVYEFPRLNRDTHCINLICSYYILSNCEFDTAKFPLLAHHQTIFYILLMTIKAISIERS